MTDRNEIRPDPVQTYQNYQDRLQGEKALQEHAWTWEEVERLEQEDIQSYAALKPYIDESHRRGDYRNPWELDRKEAREFLQARGIEGEPWSIGEVNAIAGDPALWADYQDEVKKAQAEGRVIAGPDTAKGATYHFEGEGPRGPEFETFKQNLNKKLERIDTTRRGHAAINEGMEKLRTLSKEGLESGPVATYLMNQLKTIEKNTTPEYPVEDHPDFSKLKAAYAAACKACETSGDKVPLFSQVFDLETGKPKN